MSCICVLNRDYIEVESTNAEFVTTPYRVLSVLSQFEVLCSDPAGTYGPRSPSADADDIGQFVVQDRSLNTGVCLDEYRNCGFVVPNGGDPEAFYAYPGMDRGGSTAGGWTWIEGGVMFGAQINADVDPDRCAGLFASGGGSVSSGPSFPNPRHAYLRWKHPHR